MTAYPASDKVRWREVESSNITRVGWDSAKNLYVVFHGGGMYLYKGVSRQRAVALAYAESVGRYLNRTIKPHYKATKL